MLSRIFILTILVCCSLVFGYFFVSSWISRFMLLSATIGIISILLLQIKTLKRYWKLRKDHEQGVEEFVGYVHSNKLTPDFLSLDAIEQLFCEFHQIWRENPFIPTGYSLRLKVELKTRIAVNKFGDTRNWSGEQRRMVEKILGATFFLYLWNVKDVPDDDRSFQKLCDYQQSRLSGKLHQRIEDAIYHDHKWTTFFRRYRPGTSKA